VFPPERPVPCELETLESLQTGRVAFNRLYRLPLDLKAGNSKALVARNKWRCGYEP
jgi:hypothetical protein